MQDQVASELPPGAVFHLSRAQLRAERGGKLAVQSPQILWVVNGMVSLKTESGNLRLHDGTLVFLRPGDEIRLKALAAETWVARLVIDGASIADIPEIHTELSARFLWSDAADIPILTLPPRQRATLAQAAKTLEKAPQTKLSLWAFLLPLLANTVTVQIAIKPGAPDWLYEAVASLNTPEILQGGASGLVAHSGRAHAHVSRSFRSFTGKTPSELIAEARMAEAARMLSSGEETLPEIARAVGIANLSHFHRVFRAQHGLPPAAYRAKFGRKALQPRSGTLATGSMLRQK